MKIRYFNNHFPVSAARRRFCRMKRLYLQYSSVPSRKSPMKKSSRFRSLGTAPARYGLCCRTVGGLNAGTMRSCCSSRIDIVSHLSRVPPLLHCRPSNVWNFQPRKRLLAHVRTNCITGNLGYSMQNAAGGSRAHAHGRTHTCTNTCEALV